jgi:fibronectin-binding autotransporter adhesin
MDCTKAGSYTGGTLIRGGTLRLVSDSAFGSGTIMLNGTTNTATFRFGSDGQTLNNTLNVTGTNNIVMLGGNDTVTRLTGDGTFIVNSGTTFTFGGDMSDFSGTVKAGTTTNPRFNGSHGSPNAILDLGNTSALLNTRNGSATIEIGALIGGANTQWQGCSSAVATNLPTTYVIGGKNLDTTFAGKISEVVPTRTAAITKVGTGSFTLTGANTHTGPMLINGGTLFVNNTSGSGTGTNNYVAVNDGGTLGGTGFIFGPVTNYSGGTISPGSNGVGTLTLKSNLFLSAGSAVNFHVGTTSDKLAVSNALVLNGTFNVTSNAGFGPGTYTVMTYGSALSGTLPVIGSKPAGYSIAVSTNTVGQIRLIVQVQTPPVFGGINLVGTNLVFTGTGGPTNENYFVLASTNVALPVANWTRLATNRFNATGAFAFTNAVNPALPQNFYLLQMP